MKTTDIVVHEWCKPVVAEDEGLLYDEPGRVLHGPDDHVVTYTSFCFKLVQWHASLALYVKHGGGQERINLDGPPSAMIETLRHLDSDQRYFMFFALWRAHDQARQEAYAATAMKYKLAFVDGRLKKRKKRGTDTYTVWIKPKVEVLAA